MATDGIERKVSNRHNREQDDLSDKFNESNLIHKLHFDIQRHIKKILQVFDMKSELEEEVSVHKVY